VRQDADQTITFDQLRRMSDAFIGHLVILGGEILRTWQVPGATFLAVGHRPLDREERPLLTERSEGHFIVRCDRYLEPATYATGRAVTAAGRVLGTYTAKGEENNEVSPLLACVELYLWPLATAVIDVYPDGWYWYWWEGDPWYWDPWYWRHYRHRH
jgi:outer membrane lipoprotein